MMASWRKTSARLKAGCDLIHNKKDLEIVLSDSVNIGQKVENEENFDFVISLPN